MQIVHPSDHASLVLQPEALVQELNRRLLNEYGSTMALRDIACELGTSVGALRLRQFRHGDLPATIPYMRIHRWPTPVIAVWLAGLGNQPDRIPDHTQSAPVSQHPQVGRPRKRRAPGLTQMGER